MSGLKPKTEQRLYDILFILVIGTFLWQFFTAHWVEAFAVFLLASTAAAGALVRTILNDREDAARQRAEARRLADAVSLLGPGI
jgi:hypothetical protein